MTNDYGIRAFHLELNQILHILVMEPVCRLYYLSRENSTDYYLTVSYWLDEVM